MKQSHFFSRSVVIILGFICLLGMFGCTKQKILDCRGKPVKLSEYKGKWILVNYWANWCEPCMKELPALNQFYQQHTDKIMVLGVNFDSLSDQEIDRFSQKMNISFPMLSHFPAESYGLTSISALPVSLLFSPEGKFVKVLYGPQTARSLSKETGIS
jgi:thiol-disulfide isomerase/thioredoxin